LPFFGLSIYTIPLELTLSKILEKHSVIFVDKRGSKVNLEGTPIIGCEELNKAQDKKKIMDMIEERI